MDIEQSIECLKLKIKKDNSIIQGMFGDIYDEIRKDNKAIETLITVYDKQQKEIEELKAITRTYEAYNCREDNKIVIASKEWFADGCFKDLLSNYISKDKLKEIIEKHKKFLVNEFSHYADDDIENRKAIQYASARLSFLLTDILKED